VQLRSYMLLPLPWYSTQAPAFALQERELRIPEIRLLRAVNSQQNGITVGLPIQPPKIAIGRTDRRKGLAMKFDPRP
jgi:hypothetical protein